MIVLDFFIVNVTVPSKQAELHASAIAIEWVIAGYIRDLPDQRRSA
jgi:hypothetical protein